jgi:6-phosphogluconate dehydrogenase
MLKACGFRGADRRLERTMQIGVIGLGRMGGNIARRLTKAGHRCVGYDANAKAGEALAAEGVTVAPTLASLADALTGRPRAIWVMLPAGKITEDVIAQLGALLAPGDIVVDGGNSRYKDSIRRAGELAARGIHLLDCGTSGGVWGLPRGYCLMIGGDKEAFERLDPIFAALAPGADAVPPTPGLDGEDSAARGYIHAGPSGAGHFVKMVHNGIEYGLMQAYAEGFDILRNKNSPVLPENERLELNVADIAEVWRRGSVISSWLLDIAAAALAKDPDLKAFSGEVQDSGEGRWAIEAAIEEAVPAPVLSSALFARFRSRQGNTFGEKALSAMRLGFGGHVETALPPVHQPAAKQI